MGNAYINSLKARLRKEIEAEIMAEAMIVAEEKAQKKLEAGISMLLQIGQDAGCMAANDVLHMGAGRAEQFCLAYKEYVIEIVDLVHDDQEHDDEYIFAKAKVDERLETIVGAEKFAPWEERYGQNKKSV